MKIRLVAGGLSLAILACGELAGPKPHTLALSVVPVFDANGVFAVNADRLRIRLQREIQGSFTTIKDTVVDIDAEGNVDADLNVVLVQSPQVFRVLLDAVRTTDGVTLFAGSQNVTVTSGAGGEPQQVQVPISYSGPHGTRVVMTPADTTISAGGTFSFRSTVLDAANQAVGVPVGYYLLNPADASRLTLNRLTGQATGSTTQSGSVLVLALTADSLRDTSRVFVGSVPNSIRVTPGYGAVGIGQTLTLTATVLDGAGNPLAGQGASWVSRSTGVATVSAAGVVTSVASGSAVIVASVAGISDSVRISAAPAGNVVVSATSKGRSFAAPAVNDTLSLDVIGELAFASGEKLGSYGATLTWDPAKLQLDTLVAGDFTAPTVNFTLKGNGQVVFAAANTTGASGQPVLARARFRALAAGNAATVLTITELSGPSPAFTNLFTLNRVTVTSSSVTVR